MFKRVLKRALMRELERTLKREAIHSETIYTLYLIDYGAHDEYNLGERQDPITTIDLIMGPFMKPGQPMGNRKANETFDV